MTALRLLPLLLLSFSLSALATKPITYKIHAGNAISVNDCISAAIRKLAQETCVEFSRAPALDSISFVDSGHCLWRENNRTVHLGPNCISEENCARLIAQAVTNERPQYGASRHLNLKFNCTDKCTNICQNGGQSTADCKCNCIYGFTGPQCEELKLRNQFTDNTCGVINGGDSSEGEISLSTYPNPVPKATFCQWLIKPKNAWETVEFEFIELDLNFEDRMPGTHCGDILSVYGARGIEDTLPCSRDEVRQLKTRRFRSESDWVMFALSTNIWSQAQHKGPLIKWRIISPKSNKDIRSFDPSVNSSTTIQNTAFSSVIALVLCLKVLF